MARLKNFQSPLLTLAALVLVVAALHLAKEILVPVALAIFFSFLLTPPANRLERLGLGRIPSVIAVVFVTFAGLGLLGWVVTSQLVDLGTQLPNYKVTLIRKINDIRPQSKTLENISETLKDVQASISKEGEKAKQKVDKQEVQKTNDLPKETGPSAKETHLETTASVKPTPQTDLNAAPDTMDSESLWSWATGFRWAPADKKTKEPVDVRLVGTPPSPLRQMLDWFGPLMSPLATGGIAILLVIFILLKREEQRNRLLQLFGSSHRQGQLHA